MIDPFEITDGKAVLPIEDRGDDFKVELFIMKDFEVIGFFC